MPPMGTKARLLQPTTAHSEIPRKDPEERVFSVGISRGGETLVLAVSNQSKNTAHLEVVRAEGMQVLGRRTVKQHELGHSYALNDSHLVVRSLAGLGVYAVPSLAQIA